MKFCTNCGNKLEDDDKFCTACGQKTYEIRKTQNMGKKEIKQAKKKLKGITGGYVTNTKYRQKLKNNYLTYEEGEHIKKQIENEIETRTLKSEDVENRINELIREEGKKKNQILNQKLKILDEILKTESYKTKIKRYYIDEVGILKIKNKIKRELGQMDLNIISEYTIKSLLDKELINEKEVKETEFKNRSHSYLENLIKDSCPKLELTSFEKDYIKTINVNGSIDEMKEQLKIFSEKIIDNRKKLGKFDSLGLLIEDGGFENIGPSLDLKYKTHIEKSVDIATDVFIKIFDNKLVMIETNVANYFSSNSFNQKRLIYLNDIVSLNIGSIKTNQLKDREGKYLHKMIESDSVIILSLINQEKLKIIFSEEEKGELFYKIWHEYKENQENKTSSSPQESDNSIGEDILKYAELYEKGLLTEEEFTALKKKLLGL